MVHKHLGETPREKGPLGPFLFVKRPTTNTPKADAPRKIPHGKALTSAAFAADRQNAACYILCQGQLERRSDIPKMKNLTSNRLTSLALALSLGALPAFAQDSTGEQPPTEEAPAAEASPATGTEAASDGQADVAAPSTDAEQSLGQPYVAEVAGDWQIECVRTTMEADPCRMVQMLLDQGNPAVRVEVVALPQGGQVPAVATFYTPLQTLLSEQLTLSVDGGRQSKHMFNYCSPQFCVSQVPFAPDAVAAFKRGANAQAIIVPLQAPGSKVELKMSLSGFTAGFSRLEELSVAAAAAAQKAATEAGNGN